MLSHHAALIYVMVLSAAADAKLKDRELATIGDIVSHLPVFRDFSSGNLGEIANACTDMLDQEDGVETIVELVRRSLPEHLRETAYALACDIVAADRVAPQEELRLLELLRHRLEVDRLTAAAIERGARARYAVA